MRKLLALLIAVVVCGCEPHVTKYKQGDTVQLISGSPPMTVFICYNDTEYGVEWFDESGGLESAVFGEDVLRKVP